MCNTLLTLLSHCGFSEYNSMLFSFFNLIFLSLITWYHRATHFFMTLWVSLLLCLWSFNPHYGYTTAATSPFQNSYFFKTQRQQFSCMKTTSLGYASWSGVGRWFHSSSLSSQFRSRNDNQYCLPSLSQTRWSFGCLASRIYVLYYSHLIKMVQETPSSSQNIQERTLHLNLHSWHQENGRLASCSWCSSFCNWACGCHSRWFNRRLMVLLLQFFLALKNGSRSTDCSILGSSGQQHLHYMALQQPHKTKTQSYRSHRWFTDSRTPSYPPPTQISPWQPVKSVINLS